jgi:hypothetical protein
VQLLLLVTSFRVQQKRIILQYTLVVIIISNRSTGIEGSCQARRHVFVHGARPPNSRTVTEWCFGCSARLSPSGLLESKGTGADPPPPAERAPGPEASREEREKRQSQEVKVSQNRKIA